MTGLLVSVRSAAEAEEALEGGAALIDVKEPRHGSLGRAEDAVIAEVIQRVADRRPVSAALGELREASEPFLAPGLACVKWGLAGCGNDAKGDWRFRLASEADRLATGFPPCRLVAVAYADWRRAAAPSPTDVCAFATERRVGAFLLDTWRKDGSTLLDWLVPRELAHLCQGCKSTGVAVALAGSLGPTEIAALKPLAPDWFAVRGAVCRGGRAGRVNADRVRRLVESLAQPLTAIPAS
jgi:uncharacterized protein (UPF0264 family)